MKKSFLKIALMFVMNIFLCSLAWAQWSGSGTEADPYQIKTRTDLETLAANVNSGGTDTGKYFKLMNDIDMAAEAFNQSDTRFIPIGNSPSTFFSGTFDGDSRIISNLYVSSKGKKKEVYTGLLGHVKNGKIKNLGLENANISSDNFNDGVTYTGGLVGYLDSGSIENCYVTGDVVASSSPSSSSDGYAYAGGLVGYIDSTSTCSIENCYATGKVVASSSSKASAGGLVGFIYSTSTCSIENCYATGNVASSSASAGGLVGFLVGGSIENCYATGNVVASSSSNASAGGLVGILNNGSIENCYATGDVSASASSLSYASAGGLVGVIYSTSTCSIENCYATGDVSAASSSASAGGLVGSLVSGSIENCYATGDVVASLSSSSSPDAYAYAGGLVGYINPNCSITNCYWNTETSNRSKGIGNIDKIGVIGKTTAEMKSPVFVMTLNNGQDFEAWKIDNIPNINSGYPILAPTYTIVASAGLNGCISPVWTITVITGKDTTFTMTPNNGYVIDDVQVDNVSVGTKAIYTFSKVTANHTISAI